MEGTLKIVEIDDNEKSSLEGSLLRDSALYNTAETLSVFTWERLGFIDKFEGKDENKSYLTQEQFDKIKENLKFESLDTDSYINGKVDGEENLSYTHKLVYSNKNGIEEWCKYFTSLESLRDYIKNSSLKDVEKDIQE
jgi:hypothetical protein